MRVLCGALVLALGVLVPPGVAQTLKTDKEKENTITSFGGKTLEQWRQQMTSADASKRADAVIAITNFGDENGRCVPALLSMAVNDGDVSPRVRAMVALRLVNVPDDQLSRVVRVLGSRLDPLAERQAVARLEAVVTLRRFMADPELAQVQGDLIKGTLDKSSWEIRMHSVSLLWRMAQQQKSGADARVFEALLGVLRPAETYLVKLEALQGLGALGRPNDPLMREKVIRSLDAMSRSENRPLALWAYTGLVAMNDDKVAEVFLGKITRFLQSDSLELRIQAATALGALGKRSARKVPQVLALLKDREANAVFAACGALGGIGDTSDRVVDALLELLNHKEPARAVAAVYGLVGLKLNTARVTGAMDKLLERKDLDRRLRINIEDGLKELKKPKGRK